MGDDAIDAYAYWVMGREYLRANSPGRLAEWDTKFADAIARNDPQVAFETFLGTFNAAGLELFMGQGEDFLSHIRPGVHPETCEIDWREIACASYWFAAMSAPQRESVLASIKAGTYALPELVCPPTKADGTYGTGRMPTTQVPVIPDEKAKEGMPTWQKVALGVGAVAMVAVVGIATTGGYNKNPTSRHAKRGWKTRRGEDLSVAETQAMVKSYAKTLTSRSDGDIRRLEMESEDDIISDAAMMERRRREKARTWAGR
jgi:hypothetical protein